MDTYLLTIAIGPVQTLIESARRTRDLWCGSWALSESAKAAALSLRNSELAKVNLIFPANKSEDDLAPKTFDKDYANIANVIRVEASEITDRNQLEALVDNAKRAAQRRLKDIGEQGLARFNSKANQQNGVEKLNIREELWELQINDILDFSAVWVVVKEGNFKEAVARSKDLLLQRKNSRDFLASALPCAKYGALPKSSLDGVRESVLLEKEKISQDCIRRLGLSKGEQLDALGVIKRISGDVEQFSPYPRICADDWINLLDKENNTVLEPLRSAYKKLAGTWGQPFEDGQVTTYVKGNDDQYKALPFDGELLYDFRLKNAISKSTSKLEKERLEALSSALVASYKALGNKKPVPYGVILKADGDSMGDLFAVADNIDQAQEISKALDAFASDVRNVVQKHRGHAIYAGGDDVLAMLPLSTAIDCAEALQDAFKAQMENTVNNLNNPQDIPPPTLSVGIAIGHFMQPLGHLRARAIRAEKLAKGDNQPKEKKRNALGICLGLRSGPEVMWRCQWSEKATLDQFKEFLQCYAGDRKETIEIEKQSKVEGKTIISSLPSRAGYGIRSLALEYQWSLKGNAVISALQQAELRRLLDNLQQKGGTENITPSIKTALQQQANRVGLNDLANQLIIARWLSARTQSDLGAME